MHHPPLAKLLLSGMDLKEMYVKKARAKARAFSTMKITLPLRCHQFLILGLQLLFAFHVSFIMRNAIDWAHFHTLRCVVVAYALRALVRIDDINGIALRDGAIRAFRLAYIAVDTFVGDDQ
jgi:hypothetical protein